MTITGKRSQRAVPIAVSAALVAATVLAALWFLAAEQRYAGTWGFAMDDSWIYSTFVRNLVTGHGYSFNPGVPVGGATGPLYVFLLALLRPVFPDPIWAAKILGVACHAASSVILYLAARHLLPRSTWVPILIGLLVGISPSLMWGALSGMEMPVYILFVGVGIYFAVRQRWIATTTAWSAAVWLRPDGILLAVLGVVLTRMDKEHRIRAAAVALAMVGGFVLFNLAIGGKPLPNSVYEKTHYGTEVTSHFQSMVREGTGLWGIVTRRAESGEHAVLLLPLMVAGSIALIRRQPVLAIFPFAFPLAFAIGSNGGGIHGRYLLPIIPFGMLLAGVGAQKLLERLPGTGRRIALAALVLVCVVWQFDRLGQKARIYAANVQNINGMQRYLAEATESSTSPGDTIAVNDVGAMGYFSKCYIVDLVGLTSPKRPFPENLAIHHPKFLIVFPEWYERYAVADPSTGHPTFYPADSTAKYVPVGGVQLRWNTICGGNPMLVFAPIAKDAVVPADLSLVWN